jgi:hypothetical protein
MPTSTDLVTDLPADFEVFGQAVATSMADLLGGTTGQVLAKASNTDMDFSWVAQDDSNAIQNAIVDAKGDLIGATANDTPARLAVGTNGQVLTADSTAATGLAWATASTGSTNVAGKNGCLNSNFSIWQRGTSLAGLTAVNYTADQWQLFRAGTTISRQATNDTTNLPNIQYCARVQRDSGTTGTSVIVLSQSIETLNSIPFAGKTVTLSYYARKGANYSEAASIVAGSIFTGTGTDQSYISGFTGLATAATSNSTLTTTWQRFSVSGTIASTAKEIAVNFSYTPVGTAGAADYFEVTGVQLEIASSASAYSPNSSTYALELAACQRYCFKVTNDANDKAIASGGYYASTVFLATLNFPTMRTAPTGTIVTGASYWAIYANSGVDYADSASLSSFTNNCCNIEIGGNVSGTAGHAGQLRTQNTAASIILSAEL